jgi:Tol biopolymer transport system component
LWWWSPTTGEPVRLTTGVGEYGEPRMSADGRKMVGTLFEYRRALVSIPVVFDDSPRPHQLTDGFAGDLEPSLSPSGGRMVFSSSRSGSRNLWSADADGSSTRPLTSDAAIEERPASSADGRQIAFVSDRGGEHAIWVVSSDGGTPKRIARTPVLDTLTWSPDGLRIAYAVPAGEAPALMVVGVNDGAVAKLTTPHGAHSPAWSPRGDVIAYLEPRGPGRAFLKFVSSRGQVLYPTVPDGPPMPNGFLAWAPDGKRLAAVAVPGSANASIWIVEPDSPHPFRKLIELPGEMRPRGITWTSDGSSLVFGRQEALSDLVLFERPE